MRRVPRAFKNFRGVASTTGNKDSARMPTARSLGFDLKYEACSNDTPAPKKIAVVCFICLFLILQVLYEKSQNVLKQFLKVSGGTLSLGNGYTSCPGQEHPPQS